MRTTFVLAIITLIVLGCATAHKISNVQVGMTKEEVIEVMGRPASTSAIGADCEYLNYSLSETDDQAFYGFTVPYYIRLINGHVDSYGRAADTLRLETDENIEKRSDVNVASEEDLYTELVKLKKLLDAGIITQQEFEKEKKELLDKY